MQTCLSVLCQYSTWKVLILYQIFQIGIVGRTGAGKSSLLNMLFRLGVNTGVLKMDDRDISELKLVDLRRSLSVIPQVKLVYIYNKVI